MTTPATRPLALLVLCLVATACGARSKGPVHRTAATDLFTCRPPGDPAPAVPRPAAQPAARTSPPAEDDGSADGPTADS